MWNKYVQMQHVCMHVPAAFLHGISCGACADVHSCRNKHPQWNMYKCPVTVLIFPVWINDATSVFSYGVTAFASQWRTTQGPWDRGSIRQGQQEAPPPPLNVQLPVLSESSMSTLECLTSWDMVKRKPPGTTGGPATAQHLHHVGWMCTHRKEAFLHVPFLISTGKPGPLC